MQFLRLLDTKIFLFLHSFSGQSNVLDNILIFFAEYFPYIVILIFLEFTYSHYSHIKEELKAFYYVTISSITSMLFSVELIRYFYHRPRPFLQNHFIPLFNENSFSFPSGHASFFFAMAFSIYFLHKRWGVSFIIFAIMISIARVVAGVHFPMDIFGGAIVGYIVSFLFNKLLNKNSSNFSRDKR